MGRLGFGYIRGAGVLRVGLARRLFWCRALSLLVLPAILTGPFCERKDLLSGRAKLEGKARGLLEHPEAHGGVVELQEDIAQLLVVLLELLYAAFEGLYGILLSASVGSLC